MKTTLSEIKQNDLCEALKRLERLGVSLEQFSKINSSRMFAETVADALKKDDFPPLLKYDDAHMILGKDFISPEEIAKAFCKNIYSKKMLQHYIDTLPAQHEIEWARDKGHVLVAGPPKKMTLEEINSLFSDYFCRKRKDPEFYSNHCSGHWADPVQANKEVEEIFNRQEAIQLTWLMISKNIVPLSDDDTWEEIQWRIFKGGYIPTITEVIWSFASYYKVRQKHLSDAMASSRTSMNVRTSSKISTEKNVSFDFYWKLVFSSKNSDIRYPVLSARKLR
ncbi:MAG: hypothetical protein WC682_01050 [Parcubacteria group bacterium]|jgi:hypothetical protein